MGIPNIFGALAGGYLDEAEKDKRRQFEDNIRTRGEMVSLLGQLAGSENARPAVREWALKKALEVVHSPYQKKVSIDFGKELAALPPDAGPPSNASLGGPMTVPQAPPGMPQPTPETAGGPPSVALPPRPPVTLPPPPPSQVSEAQGGVFLTPEAMAQQKASALGAQYEAQAKAFAKYREPSTNFQEAIVDAVRRGDMEEAKRLEEAQRSAMVGRSQAKQVVFEDGSIGWANYDPVRGGFFSVTTGEPLLNVTPYSPSIVGSTSTTQGYDIYGRPIISTTTRRPNVAPTRPSPPPGASPPKAAKGAGKAPAKPPKAALPRPGTPEWQQMREDAMAREAAAKEAATTTSATRTMRETAPKVKDFVKRIRPLIDRQEQALGPAASRWNEFMAGKVGAPNPEFTRLRTNIGLLQTLLMRMHVGARGGEYIMQKFTSLLDSAKQSPENLRAALDEIDAYADDIITEGQKGRTSKGSDPLGIR